jgi:hypothetical protein
VKIDFLEVGAAKVQHLRRARMAIGARPTVPVGRTLTPQPVSVERQKGGEVDERIALALLVAPISAAAGGIGVAMSPDEGSVQSAQQLELEVDDPLVIDVVA